MAYKCSTHGEWVVRGGGSTFFIRLVRGTEQLGGRQKQCASCATLTLDRLHEHAILVAEGDVFKNEPTMEACSDCHAALNGDAWSLFGHAYPKGGLPTQWFARYCDKCAPAAAEDWGLDA